MSSSNLEKWKLIAHQATGTDGSTKHERQHAAGKKTARQRITEILDTQSFEEIDQLARSSYLKNGDYSDGVIAGFGTIAGYKVALFAQDFTFKGGSLGKRHAEKICKIMDLALKVGCPIIGILDSGGARIDEGIHALAGYGSVFMRNVKASGVIPQISLILGPCAGGAVYSPALTDFIFMTENISQMFITGPQVVAQALGQSITKEELGGAYVHATQSGVTHIVTQTEEECFEQLKALLSYLPAHYRTTAARPVGVEPTLKIPLASLVPENTNQAYDIKQVVQGLVDGESFFEIQALFAPNIVIGFARMDGMSVGIVANQPFVKAGTLDIDASCKAARFINFCNSFGIPIISLVDVPGFLPGIDQEHNGIIRHGAKLLYAYANATVPKITLILRKAFGGAYIVMGSKKLGADFNIAWPQAQIAVLSAATAVSILHGKRLAQLDEETKIAKKTEFEETYATEFLNPFIAAEHGYIDTIIEPNDTRSCILKALSFLESKVEQLPKKKSGNIPL
ncbi:acyl-CoA carboxylase subunit beta [Candidatus Dependentiae bacterium]|nr:acyl-CoA carboxylase subunit beta [Candidatus Dependentiae bacterium]